MSVYNNYASALIDGSSPNELKLFVEDFQDFLKILDNKDIFNMLKSPILSTQKKVDLLKNPLMGLNVKVVKAINALILRGHSIKLKSAINEIIKHLESSSGIESATLQSPIELDETEIDSIRTTLSNILHKKVRIKVVIDRSLIAGFKVQVGGKFFDNSISNHLNKMKERFKLSEGKYEN